MSRLTASCCVAKFSTSEAIHTMANRTKRRTPMIPDLRTGFMADLLHTLHGMIVASGPFARGQLALGAWSSGRLNRTDRTLISQTRHQCAQCTLVLSGGVRKRGFT